MRRLRQSLLLRFSAVGLLLSLGLGLSAPAAAAGGTAGTAPWIGVDAIPEATLEAALSAAAAADTPEAFAEAVSEVLRARLGEAAPPADALLAALYGQLFRVLQEEVGDCAVVVAAGSGGAVQAPLEGAVAPGVTPGERSFQPVAVQGQEPLSTPRALRPAVQPLGP